MKSKLVEVYFKDGNISFFYVPLEKDIVEDGDTIRFTTIKNAYVVITNKCIKYFKIGDNNG